MYRLLSTLCLMLSTAASAQTLPPDSAEVNNEIFTKVDVEASFPGGETAWRTFLQKNLNPSVPADNGAPLGKYTVMVQFVVDKDGKVSNLTPTTKLGYGMEQEVLRVLQKSGDWTPAFQNGRRVNAYRRQPFSFVIEEDGIDITSTSYTLNEATDNEIGIKVRRVKTGDIDATISKGTITKKADGKFIVSGLPKLNDGVMITFINSKRDNSEICKVHFTVRPAAVAPKNSN